MNPIVHNPTGKPRICFVGPMLGTNPGWVPNPMEALAPRLSEIGYSTILTSRKVPRLARWADIISTLFRRRRDYDLICLQIYSGPSFVLEDSVMRASRVLGRPVVGVLHGGAFPAFASRWPVWTRSVLGSVRLLVAPSPYLARTAAAMGLHASIIPNLLELEGCPFRLRLQAKPALLWMRTFHDIYNPQMAVRMLEQVRQRLPEARLLMCGQEKGLLPEVRALADQLNLAGAVEFRGFVSGASKRAAFEESDIYLNTNRIDNMPVSILEAFAYGTPVVATRVGGISDVVDDGRTGLLVPDGDAAAMANAVCRLINTPELVAQLSANGRQTAETCGWTSVRPAWERTFAEALT